MAEARLYEGMFIVDMNTVGTDDRAVRGVVQRLIDKHGGTVVVNKRWAEREFAYPIRRQIRGIYQLTYFKCEPEVVAKIKRDCCLSDEILRVMILRRKAIPERVVLPDGKWMELVESRPPEPEKPREADVGGESDASAETREAEGSVPPVAETPGGREGDAADDGGAAGEGQGSESAEATDT